MNVNTSAKTCTKCGVKKSTILFHKRNTACGYESACKSCKEAGRRSKIASDQTYQSENKKLWQLKNRDKISGYNKKWYCANREAKLHNSSVWRKENRHIMNAHAMKRRAAKLNATPSWLTTQHLKDIEVEYKLAQWTSKVTGIKMHVDHIVPLQGFDVCGLHVPWNLQVIPATENISKGNKYVHKR